MQTVWKISNSAKVELKILLHVITWVMGIASHLCICMFIWVNACVCVCVCVCGCVLECGRLRRGRDWSLNLQVFGSTHKHSENWCSKGKIVAYTYIGNINAQTYSLAWPLQHSCRISSSVVAVVVVVVVAVVVTCQPFKFQRFHSRFRPSRRHAEKWLSPEI